MLCIDTITITNRQGFDDSGVRTVRKRRIDPRCEILAQATEEPATSVADMQILTLGSYVTSRTHALLEQPSFVVESAGIVHPVRTLQTHLKPPLLTGA